MCDKAAYNKLREDVEALKQDQAVHNAKSEERFKTLFGILKWVISFMLTITMILLLTVIYGAVGERGFHSLERGFHFLMPHVKNGIVVE
jgi:hypothetical protein